MIALVVNDRIGETEREEDEKTNVVDCMLFRYSRFVDVL